MSGTRYAIRMSDGLYSDGPRMRPEPLSKARLWTNVGHVKTHLQGIAGEGRRYGPDAVVVEVVVMYNEREWGSVAGLVAEYEKRDREHEAEQAAYAAQRDLHEAERRLAEARAKAERLGLRSVSK